MIISHGVTHPSSSANHSGGTFLMNPWIEVLKSGCIILMSLPCDIEKELNLIDLLKDMFSETSSPK